MMSSRNTTAFGSQLYGILFFIPNWCQASLIEVMGAAEKQGKKAGLTKKKEDKKKKKK